jgi:predicted TIM-barrel fold metal-dependent hydrolase
MWLAFGVAILAAEAAAPGIVPAVDYHQHLVNPAFGPIARMLQRDGGALVQELDAAGIRRAVVLSVGYSFGDERKALEDPDRATREQNDWTAAEVSRHASRLVGFCSVNPLRPAALAEIERSLGLPGMVGIKLHLGNSGVSLRDPAHRERLKQVFALAQRLGAPVLVHMRARGGKNYGAEDVRLFLDAVVPAAPDIEIVVAHLGGSGPGYPPQNDDVLAAFAAAAAERHPMMANLYFDVATNVTSDITRESATLLVQRIRQIGLGRVLYGSDLSPPGGGIREGWEIFRSKLPLDAEELGQVARNRTRFVQ